MFPLIGSFLVSIVGHLVGKSISQAWENSKNAPAQTSSTQTSSEPFATALTDETRRYAEAPGLTATDAPTMGLPPATVNFAGSTGSGFSLSEIQTQ